MFTHFISSWAHRLNPEDQISRKPEDQKNDQMTKNTKKYWTLKYEYYSFEFSQR